MTNGRLDGVDGTLPTGGVSDADGGGDSLRILDGMAVDNGGGSGGLVAEHAREGVGLFRGVVFLVAFPVGGDVAGVADGDEMKVRRIAELVADLEGGGLLPFQAHGVDAVDYL